MSATPIRVVNPGALEELRQMLAADEEFADEDAVYDYEDTLSVYQSLLLRALNVKPKRDLSGAGLEKLLTFIAERLPLRGATHAAALGVGSDIAGIQAIAGDYFGSRDFQGSVSDAEAYRAAIVDALNQVLDAIEKSTQA